MSQENQSHPTLPTERNETTNFIGKFYKQPGIGLEQTDNSTQNATKNPSPFYECNLCSRKYTRHSALVIHNKIHTFFNFACWICKRNFNMSHSNMISHFKHHEKNILLRTGYTKLIENQLYSILEKRFGDEWPVSVFKGDILNDLTDVVKVNTFLKNRMFIQIRCKLWYVPNPSSEFNTPKFVWLTLPNIQFEWSDLNIKRKIFDVGGEFMNTFLEQSNVEDSGSGFVYYATSEISIKCVKNTNIGCVLPYEHKYSELLPLLASKNIIVNPLCNSYCLRQCLISFSSISNQNIQLNNKIFNQPYVTFLDFEEWDQEGIDFGLRLIILDENRLELAHPIFVSTEFHSKLLQINLLVIPNNDDSAHFVLIQNLTSFLRSIKKITSETKTRKSNFFCKYCLQKNSFHYSVISQHEKFCLHNPTSSHNDKGMHEMIEFKKEKTFLKCSNRGRNPPNWIGFLDFETVASSFDHIQSNICPNHSENILSCKCSFTLKGEPLKSLSYSLVIADFNTSETLVEIFYIPKNIFDLSAAEHFVLTLKKIAYAFQIINEINFPIEMSKQEKLFHEKQTHCQHCGVKFIKRKDNIPLKPKDLLQSDYFLERAKTFSTALTAKQHFKRKQILSTTKTAHHIHHLEKSNFSATICSKCNLKIQSRYQNIPIFCHNFSRFDHVLIIKELCKLWPKRIQFIPKSLNNIMAVFANPFELKDSLNFLSGSLDENVRIVKKSCEIKCDTCRNKDQCKRCKIRTVQKLKDVFPTIYSSALSKVDGVTDMERFLHNLEKFAFPYSILHSYNHLKNMKSFPKKDVFDSLLQKQEIDQKEYLSAKTYFELYCTNMYDFLKVYNSLDTHLLFSVWRVMSQTLSSKFGFYLERFVSLPGYSIEVAKSFTPHPHLPEHTCIELFTEHNKDIYFKSLENIRGGVVLVNSRFELDTRLAKFIDLDTMEKNEELKDFNNIEKHEELGELMKMEDFEELLYLDATNLYGFALSCLLPCGDYKTLSKEYITNLNKVIKLTDIEKKYENLNSVMGDESPYGYAFEIKIVFIPDKLYEFPPFFAKQNIKSTDLSENDKECYKKMNGKEYNGNRNKKLIPLLKKGESIFCHYKLLKEAIKLGAVVEVVSGISFKQKYLFRNYIAVLAKLRANTTNEAHARSLKLLSNALFGKLLQSVFKYNRNFFFFFVNDLKNDNVTKINELMQERHRGGRKLIFKDIKIMDQDFFAIETQNEKIEATNCPLIAFSILEIAKARNFSFFWKMKSVSPNTKMLYCDTDSFLIKCSKVWYKEVEAIKDEFDFSKAAFKFSHLMNITCREKLQNKGIIGKYKSEIDEDSVLMGYIGLQKKSYCLLIMKKFLCPVCQKYSYICKCKFSNYQGKQLYYILDNPTAKGKLVNQLSFQNYLDSILFNELKCENRFKIAQERKKLFFEFMRYKSINCFDDSNFSLDCGIHNVPFSNFNQISNKCSDQSCKFSLKYLSYLHQNLEALKKELFVFENGVLKCWKPPQYPQSLLPPSSILSYDSCNKVTT